MANSERPPSPQHPAGPLFAFADRSGPAAPHPGAGRPAADATAAWDEQSLAKALAALVGAPIEVAFGRARSYPVQATREPGGQRHVRLNAFFRHAPPQTVEDLAAWLRSGNRAGAAAGRLDAYLEQSVAALGKRELPRRRVTRGRVHDLLALHGELGQDPTAAPVHSLDPLPVISFGRFSSRKPRRRLLLGSYDPERHWVRLHPLLDDERIPELFVRFLLFHELLHAALPSERDSSGRIRHHGPHFRQHENAYSGTAAAHEFERKNQPLLFRLARRGG